MVRFPKTLPLEGVGEADASSLFSELISSESAPLGDALAFAHMDPPPLGIAASVAAMNASVNQNLLHPDLSPLATRAEETVLDWLTPFFGMSDGLMCSGSSIANLTALWCAREHGATRVLASTEAHLSVMKSAHLLGLECVLLPVNERGQIQGLNDAVQSTDCCVLTAGTTGRGAIDTLQRPDVTWLHVDAAWAGPLRLTQYKER